MCIRDRLLPLGIWTFCASSDLAGLPAAIEKGTGEEQVAVLAVSYTHLDVYKRQVSKSVETVSGLLLMTTTSYPSFRSARTQWTLA